MKNISFVAMLISLALFNWTSVGAEELIVTGNGNGSQNEIQVTNQTTTTVEQTNQTQINNDIQTSADTGNNNASDSNGDNTDIATGDINSETKIENQANQSQVNNECCPTPGITATISGNGADSQNNININITNQTNVDVSQSADINNEVSGQANTGGNEASNNGGDVSIDTGNITATADINNHDINITQVLVGQGGTDASISITNNGANSQNEASIIQTQQNTINIDNEAQVNNEVQWDLSTGDNFANGNLGDIAIVTGNIDFGLSVENGPINISEVIISCCVSPTPIPTSTPSPSVSPGPSTSPTPTSTPTSSPSEGGAGESAAGGGAAAGGAAGPGGGEVLGAAAAGEVLAAAGNYWLMFLTIIGVLSLVAGLYLRFNSQVKVTIKRLKLLS